MKGAFFNPFFMMVFYAKLLEPLEDAVHDIFLGKGVEIQLNLASRPMINALRKKYAQNPKSMLITQLGVCFLFSFEGFKTRDEVFWKV